MGCNESVQSELTFFWRQSHVLELLSKKRCAVGSTSSEQVMLSTLGKNVLLFVQGCSMDRRNTFETIPTGLLSTSSRQRHKWIYYSNLYQKLEKTEKFSDIFWGFWKLFQKQSRFFKFLSILNFFRILESFSDTRLGLDLVRYSTMLLEMSFLMVPK